MSESTFHNVREFVDHVGRKRLCGQGAYAGVVHNWIATGEISSRWIPIFIQLYGPDLPLHLFNARHPIEATP